MAQKQNIDLNNLYLSPMPVKLALGAIIVVIAHLAGFFLFYSDMNDQLNSLKKTETDLKAQFTEKAKLAANLPVLQKQMEELKKAFEDLKRQLPSDVEVADLIQKMHEAASKNGLQYKTSVKNDPLPDGSIIRLPYSIEMYGTYDMLKSFARDVGSMDRIIYLDDVNLSVANDNDIKDLRSLIGAPAGEQILKLTAVANTFMVNEEDAGGNL